MTTNNKLKFFGLSLTVLTIMFTAVWWAATTTTNLEHVGVAVEPIPEMQRDIATIKAVILANPIAYDENRLPLSD